MDLSNSLDDKEMVGLMPQDLILWRSITVSLIIFMHFHISEAGDTKFLLSFRPYVHVIPL